MLHCLHIGEKKHSKITKGQMAEENPADTAMADTSLASSIDTATKGKNAKLSKSYELYQCNFPLRPFAYAHIEVLQRPVSGAGAQEAVPLDALQARSYCDAALKQFLGATGAAMPLDLLKLEGSHFWVRLPNQDLDLFAAALAAWSPALQDGVSTALYLKASGDWLGSLVGRSEQQALWDAT